MLRFLIFVDGSNLFGVLKNLNLEVDDYEALFRHIYREAARLWHEVTGASSFPTQLRRVYWYVVATMDDWDLTIPQSQMALRERFRQDYEIRNYWVRQVAVANPGLPADKLEDLAWVQCFNEFRDWYAKKRSILDGMRRFHQGLRISTDIIDVIEAGHWKVNFLHKLLDEKGLDTALAVDMVALDDNYDVALLLSGDADSIPSVRYVKNRNKHVAAVEFIAGSPPEARGRAFSSRLRQYCDFVVPVYETDLVKLKLARPPRVAASAPIT